MRVLYKKYDLHIGWILTRYKEDFLGGRFAKPRRRFPGRHKQRGCCDAFKLICMDSNASVVGHDGQVLLGCFCIRGVVPKLVGIFSVAQFNKHLTIAM